LHHELEKHLLRINHKLDGNEGGKLAVCYGYQLVRDGEHKLIGSTEPNHVVQVEENLHQQQLPRIAGEIAGEIAGGVTGATAFPLMKTRNLLEI
jgi:hypothetical protein